MSMGSGEYLLIFLVVVNLYFDWKDLENFHVTV